ncbi:hypothetical protein [Clostridium sp.]|jgi:hypothetical protein|nr:hypothetical protein [Clostridium sp.]MDF2505459.1 hypothetical protein [Clostridium sp.]
MNIENKRSTILKVSVVLLISGAVIGGLGFLLGGLHSIVLPNIPGYI